VSARKPIRPPQWFKWTIEIQVEQTWVADGFDLTDERALDMLAHELGWADIGTELKAKVLTAPARHLVLKVQGYDKEAEAARPRSEA
jgi:hypothetical protein